MGVVGGSDMQTQFWTHVDVNFSLSGTTDNGLTFGASVDLDEADNINGDGNDGVAIFLSGNFGTVTMGDTDGALDWAMTEMVGNPGSIADNETTHGGYAGSFLDGAYDNQILRYDTTIGGLGFAASVELDDSGDRDEGVAVGIRYSVAGLNLGLGYQSATVAASSTGSLSVAGACIDDCIINFVPGGYQLDVDVLGISANYSMGSVVAGVSYATYDATYADGTGEMDQVVLSLGYSMDAISVGVNWAQMDGSFTVGGSTYLIDQEGWGAAAAYDLGGGAALHLGYGSAQGGDDTWSFGLAMSF